MHDIKDITAYTVEIVAAHVGRFPTTPSELPELIHTVFDTLAKLETRQPVGAEIAPPASMGAPIPAVPVAESIKPDHIVCLEDGKQLRMLKRYLNTHYGLTPDAYRTKWSLPRDYPMVAPNASKRRSAIAKGNGLGGGRRRPKKSGAKA